MLESGGKIARKRIQAAATRQRDATVPLLGQPAQCTSLLDPPRARFSPKSIVNACLKRAPARTLGVLARIPSKELVVAWWRRD